jgi:ribosomal protein S18 acetylase RimI-like enzyme
LHVLPEFRHLGIGRSLLKSVKTELIKRGGLSVMLWTLQCNPIRGWYEKIGGIVIGEKMHAVEGCEIVDVAYGWPELANLSLDH